jgi:hypothetical protein
MAVPPKVRTVLASIAICDGLGSAARTLDRYSPFVIHLPYSTYTSPLSKIRSSARLYYAIAPQPIHAPERVRAPHGPRLFPVRVKAMWRRIELAKGLLLFSHDLFSVAVLKLQRGSPGSQSTSTRHSCYARYQRNGHDAQRPCPRSTPFVS